MKEHMGFTSKHWPWSAITVASIEIFTMVRYSSFNESCYEFMLLWVTVVVYKIRPNKSSHAAYNTAEYQRLWAVIGASSFCFSGQKWKQYDCSLCAVTGHTGTICNGERKERKSSPTTITSLTKRWVGLAVAPRTSPGWYIWQWLSKNFCPWATGWPQKKL